MFLSHALIIIIAAIFEITFLKTYEWGSRFGFLSLFNSQNEFSYVVMAGIMFFYAKVEIKPLIKIIKLAIMTIAGLLVGTKAIILFLLILSGYFLLFRTKPKRAIPFVLFIVLMFLFLWEKILHFFKANYNTLYNLYESEGFLSFLSSKRTSYVGDRLMNSLEEFDFTNYLFGTYDLGNLYEMSLLDIPFFFGVIGTGLFGYIIYRFVLKKMFFNQQLSAYLIIVIGISLVAGYLMENASAQLYTLLVLMVLGDDFSSSSFRTDKNKEKIKL